MTTTPGSAARTRQGRRYREALGVLVMLWVTGCASGRGRTPERTYDHRAVYRVSCSVSDQCRVTFIGENGELDAQDIVGEWTRELGADDGTRLWVRAGAGGCPPRPVRVEIVVDERTVAERLARPPGAARCEWILAETDFRIP